MKIEILGVRIDAVTRAQALEAVSGLIGGKGGRLVVTPNPEMLVLARRDEEFRRILNSADLAIPDGVGLLWAARRAGRPLPERVTGTDLMLDVAGRAAAEGWRIFLLGGAPGAAREAAAELQRRHPGLVVAGAESGGRVERDAAGRLRIDGNALEALRQARPDILFVAFGHGTQEKWLKQNLAGLPGVRVAMGIGGAFDFIAGRAKRAPASWRRFGLEWLWRLIREPRRFRRIWDAVAVFPFLLITGKN